MAPFLDMGSAGFCLGKQEVRDLASLPRPIRSELMPCLTKRKLIFYQILLPATSENPQGLLACSQPLHRPLCVLREQQEARLRSQQVISPVS